MRPRLTFTSGTLCPFRVEGVRLHQLRLRMRLRLRLRFRDFHYRDTGEAKADFSNLGHCVLLGLRGEAAPVEVEVQDFHYRDTGEAKADFHFWDTLSY